VQKFNAGQLSDILNKEKVVAGDVFFLPAGRVHTIGKGLLIAEIQQTSDITYRIYDFDRLDAQGNKRPLHVAEALDAIDFVHYPNYKTTYTALQNKPVELVKCPYFTTNLLDYTTSVTKDYTALDSFVIHICIAGSYILKYENEEIPLAMGDCVLLPATINQFEMFSDKGFKVLESYI
ncbi:MAG: mannose-6-phosphate isomerase, partial [Sphingobacteriales bacterium]